MKRFALISAIWIILLAIGIAPTAHAATGAQVDAAVKKAKDFLYAQQVGDHWEEVPRPVEGDGADVKAGQWGGPPLPRSS